MYLDFYIEALLNTRYKKGILRLCFNLGNIEMAYNVLESYTPNASPRYSAYNAQPYNRHIIYKSCLWEKSAVEYTDAIRLNRHVLKWMPLQQILLFTLFSETQENQIFHASFKLHTCIVQQCLKLIQILQR